MKQVQPNSSNESVQLSSDHLISVINQCYQCGKCSTGCPVASEMDMLPHQMVRSAVLGLTDRIVNSKSIWLCLTCHTCGARCPNGIDVPALLDPIRHQVLARNIETSSSNVPVFHRAFLKNVNRFGRVHELALVGDYKMKTKTFFADMKLGMDMFRKGRMRLFPKWLFGNKEVKSIFKKSTVK